MLRVQALGMPTTKVHPHSNDRQSGSRPAGRDRRTALLIGSVSTSRSPLKRHSADRGDPRAAGHTGPRQSPDEAGTGRGAFRQVPAVTEFPGAMAERVQALCDVIARDYGGDAPASGRGSRRSRPCTVVFAALPGFGKLKATIMVGWWASISVSSPPDGMRLRRLPDTRRCEHARQRQAYQAANAHTS